MDGLRPGLRRFGLPWLLLAAAGPAAAATFKVTWLAPADDPRMDRGRLERGALGHPTGPAVDALKVALAEGRLELEAAGSKLELEVVEVADLAGARAAAARAEKAGHAEIGRAHV
jgi:hypothetical protein